MVTNPKVGKTQNIPCRHRTWDFGIVCDTLPAGNYQVYLLAHQSKLATFSKDVFSFDEPSDSFYKTRHSI